MQRQSSSPPRAAPYRDGLAQMLGASLMLLCALPVSAAVWSVALWMARA